jgi:hypothetical protein
MPPSMSIPESALVAPVAKERRALVEGEAAQAGTADLARVGQAARKVEAVRARVRDDRARGGIAQRDGGAVASLPAAGDEAL